MMAVSGKDTGGSQFFITHSRQSQLDGIHTVFGRVVARARGGVENIQRGDRIRSVVVLEDVWASFRGQREDLSHCRGSWFE